MLWILLSSVGGLFAARYIRKMSIVCISKFWSGSGPFNCREEIITPNQSGLLFWVVIFGGLATVFFVKSITTVYLNPYYAFWSIYWLLLFFITQLDLADVSTKTEDPPYCREITSTTYYLIKPKEEIMSKILFWGLALSTFVLSILGLA